MVGIVKRAIIMVEDKENLLSIGHVEKFLMGKKEYGLLKTVFIVLLQYSNNGVIDYRKLYENIDKLPFELSDFLYAHTQNHCPPDMERDILLRYIGVHCV